MPDISHEIEEFIRRPPPRPEGLADLAREAHVLPLVFAWTACGGLRPDGVPVWVDYEPPYRAVQTESLIESNTILHRAATRYPSLRGLDPVRPPAALVCFQCAGTGVAVFDGKQLPEATCICGGLGWLAEDPQVTLPRSSGQR